MADPLDDPVRSAWRWSKRMAVFIGKILRQGMRDIFALTRWLGPRVWQKIRTSNVVARHSDGRLFGYGIIFIISTLCVIAFFRQASKDKIPESVAPVTYPEVSSSIPHIEKPTEPKPPAPSTARILPNNTLQAERLAFINSKCTLLDLWQPIDIFQSGSSVKIYVKPVFMNMSVQQKASFCNVVFAFFFEGFPESQMYFKSIDLRDHFTGKSIGSYSTSGLNIR